MFFSCKKQNTLNQTGLNTTTKSCEITISHNFPFGILIVGFHSYFQGTSQDNVQKKEEHGLFQCIAHKSKRASTKSFYHTSPYITLARIVSHTYNQKVLAREWTTVINLDLIKLNLTLPWGWDSTKFPKARGPTDVGRYLWTRVLWGRRKGE